MAEDKNVDGDVIFNDIEGCVVGGGSALRSTLTVQFGDNEPRQLGRGLGDAADGFATLTSEETHTRPTVSLTTGFEFAPGTKWTLVMTDPDAPSPVGHIYREFVHWVVANIDAAGKGTAAKDASVTYTLTSPDDKAEHALPYLGSAPPHGSGLHRYVFLLLEQPEGVDVDAAAVAAAFEGRGGKKAHVVLTEMGLRAEPLAVGGFLAEWDASVDAAHEAMGWTPPEEFWSPKQQAKQQAKKD